MTANYYRNAHAVILVYSLDEEGTLYALNEWVGEALEMTRMGDRLVFALWGTKSDLPEDQKVVKDDAVSSIAELYHIPSELNCKVTVLDNSVEKAFTALVEHIDREFNASASINEDTRDFNKLTDYNLTPTTKKRHCNCKYDS